MRLVALGSLLTLSVLALGCGDDDGPTPQQDASTGSPIGAACTAGEECASGQCLTDELGRQLLSLPDLQTYGGYCLLFPCDVAGDDSDCGGGHCFNGQPYGLNIGVCLKTCTTATDCRQSYECFQDVTAIKACVPQGLIPTDGGTPPADAATQD